MKNALIFIALSLPLAFASCTKMEAPQFKKFGGFKVKKLGLQEAEIAFGVVYLNPNNFGVTVKEAAIDVYLDSVHMGKFIQPQTVEVDKKSEFTIPLQGSIPVAKAIRLGSGDFLNKQFQVRAAGNVRVGKAGVFITRDINYTGKHQLDIDL